MSDTTAITSALEALDQSLSRLETAIDARMKAPAPVKGLTAKRGTKQTELELDIQHEREVNRLLAAKLDTTIQRLETLLTEGDAA